MPLGPSLDGTLFSKKSLDSDAVNNPRCGHDYGMLFDQISALLEQTRPPDSELVDLIEQAFLEGQIDGKRADLAYSWLRANREICRL